MPDFPYLRLIDAHGSIDHWTAPDGWRLRRFDMPSAGPAPRGSILFQGGRGDIFEKYLEAFARWHGAGWNVSSLDWRGQGGSGRLGSDPRVGHLTDFAPLVRDLHDFWRVWRDVTPGPHIVMGHSMGGYLVLRALVEDAIDPDAAVLVAPMLGLHGAPFGVGAMEKIAGFMTRIGKPDRAAWKSNEKPATLTTRQALLTHSKTRYDEEIAWKLERPEITVGPPSWAWVAAAFEGTRLLRADPRLATMAVPTLILSPDADKLVDASAGRAIAAKLPDTKPVRYGGESAHELLREADPVRERALAEIDAFLDARAPAPLMFDFAIVGAGIAGASLAAELAPHGSVVLLEAESQPGYHATGRSAAFWSETYGGAGIQPLTSASGPLLRAGGFLEPLGSLHIGRVADRAAADAFLAEFAGTSVGLEEVDPAAIVPGLRPDWTIGISEPSCAYIDVGGLHADCLARAKRHGAVLITDAGLRAAKRITGGWEIETTSVVSARILVNAAGAWADDIARHSGVAPLGIRAYRRTMAQLRTDPAASADLPHVAAIDGSFYFKPEAGGKLWLSPHDEIETDPGDAQPEELDVAIAIDRFQNAVDWRVAAVERKWAGLRSFAPDRLPVYGFDAKAEGFFWFAGQGGFGIQTAPAAAMLAASLITGVPRDAAIASIDPSAYAPDRAGIT